MQRLRAAWFAGLVVVACGGLVATACSPQTIVAKSPDANANAEKTFGVLIQAPPDWHVLNNEDLEEIRKVTADAILGDDQELMRMAEASQQARTVIFSAFRYGPDATVDYNPSVYASSTSLAEAPDMTARRYLRDVITGMRALGVKMVIDGDFRVREIDGQTFHFARINLVADGVLVTQDYYGARHGDDMINLIHSYAGEAQRLETDKVVSAIELDW